MRSRLGRLAPTIYDSLIVLLSMVDVVLVVHDVPGKEEMASTVVGKCCQYNLGIRLPQASCIGCRVHQHQASGDGQGDQQGAKGIEKFVGALSHQRLEEGGASEGHRGYPLRTYQKQGQDAPPSVGDWLSTLLLPSTSSTTALSSVWGVRPNISIRFKDVINSNELPFLASFWLLCDEMQVMGQGSQRCATSLWENILGMACFFSSNSSTIMADKMERDIKIMRT
jgi:hypothetical protein